MKFRLSVDDNSNRIKLSSIKLLEPIKTNLLFTHPNNIIYKKENRTHLYNIFDVIFNHFGSSYEFIFDMEKEIFGVTQFKKNGLIDILLEYSKNNNISILDGNVSDTKTDIGIPHNGRCIFWGGSSILNKEFQITKREFGRHFICLQMQPKKQRQELYYYLYENNLLYKTFYTYAGTKPTHRIHYTLNDGTNINTTTERDNNKIDGKSVMYYPNFYFKNAFCYLITESSFYENFPPVEHGSDKIFFTEKTEKAFTAGIPFILIGNRYSLKYLKKIGFKTFNKWWDESYDNEVDEIRMIKIQKIISEISTWSLKKCSDIYQEMWPVLKHNQELNSKLKYKQTYKGKQYEYGGGKFTNLELV